MKEKNMSRRWGSIIFVLTYVFFSSTALAVLRPPIEPPKWLKPWKPPEMPIDYRSPGELHKVVVEKGDTVQPKILRKIRPWNEYQYLKRKLYLVSTSELEKLDLKEKKILKIRDDFNLIRLRDRYFDTTMPIPAVSENLRLITKQVSQLHLVQFVGPVQDDWVKRLKRIEGVKIVDYIPENAYLVWASSSAREEIAKWVEFQYYVQWHGPFHPAYRLHPSFDLEYDGEVTATVQLVTHEQVENTISVIKAKSSKVLRDTYRVGSYTNIVLKLPASELVTIAKLEDVANVEPWVEPTLSGERQGQIVAENLNAAGTGPGAPGYLAWLNGLGFTTNFDFVVDITDDGFDQGQTGSANVHEDFLDPGGNSRIAYVRRIDGTTISTANDQNCGGHGTINAAIVGGFNNTPATDPDFDYYADNDGYRFGLGIAPYVRLGSSKIFNLFFTNPDYTVLIDNAYSDGARISSNSWGTTPADGTYTADSQEYDSLVRDGRPTTAPSGGEEGNQEMVIVFAAGNEGAGARTIRRGGPSAKNTITVGACENFNATGDLDGCNQGNNDANDIRDVANFSSSGSCDGVNGRVKPDIMAPGTHVFGAASQDACFNGDSVCGGPGNVVFNGADDGDSYYPADPDTTDTRDQDLYTWSSGTSHATPAVSGGAALLRHWFLNKGFPAPSPAMTKAYLMNSATHMTGVDANDDFPSNNQGMGRMNLGMAFDNTPRLLFDQMKTCYSANVGEVFTINGAISDNTRPFRVTLAWTDAAGATVAGGVLKNDLDLEVQVGANFYRGNDFTLSNSNVGNIADLPDDVNNVESVYLPAGTTGNFTVTVRPSDINYDGVPTNIDATDQDFALVIYNAEFPARNPVDIILVLDRSGSMNSIAAGGTDKKIDLLKDAVEIFIRTWLPFSIPQDRIGIVYFNNGITKYPNQPTILLPFQVNANTLINNVRAITATNCTALGGGILTALRGFDNAAGHQKHIVVFTNGMQNCSPMVTQVGSAHQILDDPTPPCCDSGVLDQPGDNLADYNVKAIHTIGTGVSGATWVDLISDIANETGGTHHFTSDPDEQLEDYFLETLVAALRVDPVGKVKTAKDSIKKTDSFKEEFFEINGTVRKATFALSWRGERRRDALTFDLVAPDGTPIPAALQNLQYDSFYRIAAVDFPLQVHGSQIEPLGSWKVVVKPQLEVPEVTYRVHLIIDDGDLRYHFDVPDLDYGVGDVIPLSFWVQHGSRTLTNLTGEVTATIARPPVGFGTFMVKHPVTKQQLDADIDLSGDMFSMMAAKKAHILVQNDALRRELSPAVDTIALYDDGKPEHGDVKSNDGVYSALYKKTERPGNYNIDLTVKGRDPQVGTIVRSESKTISVGMKQFDMDKSTVEMKAVRPVEEGKAAYIVKVILIDRYGNYLGPGHSVDIVVSPPGKKWGPIGRRARLNDNLDGSYSGRVELTEEEVQTGAGLVIDVNGKRITRVEKLPPYGKRSGSVHVGTTVPTGSFNNNYDPDYSLGLDIDYHFTPQFSVMGLLGYNHFNSGSPSVSDTYWWNISANLKYEFTTNPLRPYANGGPGIYIPKSGSTKMGFNAGLGLDYSLTPDWTIELGVDYHSIFTSGTDTQFTVPHIGLIYRF